MRIELDLKGLVGCRRRPKLAFAAVQKACSPLAEAAAGSAGSGRSGSGR